ncbi:MAG TPA: hypothetical protein VNM16_05850, partial [Bacillota bacterium]|nr:hypothetical protein [Bacillota bacterium]
DLNPVAVLATRALVDYPARFQGRDLAGDLRRYGRLVGEAAKRQIGHAYPEAGGRPPVAWIWARTMQCPACGAEIPLAHSFCLSTRPGREAYAPGYAAEGTVSRRGARCLECGHLTPLAAITGFGPHRLLAVVMPGRRYLAPSAAHVDAALAAVPPWAPETATPVRALGLTAHRYGLTRHRDLHTDRQLLALATFADLVRGFQLEDGPYGQAIQTYLGLALGRAAARWCTFARWQRSRENVEHAFGRPGLAMAWDFAEANPFGTGAGSWIHTVDTVARALAAAPDTGPAGSVLPLDAASLPDVGRGYLVCTDPPYLDTLPYADMADLFYVWLRPALAKTHPDLFAAPLTPKAQEIVADPRRLGGIQAARAASLVSLRAAFAQMRDAAEPGYPLLIFYGMKRAEDWAVVLQALLGADLRITAAWPLRTEHGERLRRIASNAMSATILLCCRPRDPGAPPASWPAVEAAMRAELAVAVPWLIALGVTPVDLAQAAIGPALGVFAAYRCEGVGIPEVLGSIQAAVEEAVAAAAAAAASPALGDLPPIDGRTAALAHHRYFLAMRSGRRQDALRYNDLVSAWGARLGQQG